eukprot:775767-Prymnesium_polylepis.1
MRMTTSHARVHAHMWHVRMTTYRARKRMWDVARARPCRVDVQVQEYHIIYRSRTATRMRARRDCAWPLVILC